MLRDSLRHIVRVMVLFAVVSLSAIPTWGQKTKSQLKKEKQEKLERIKEVEKILNETASQKKSSLGELNAVNQKIKIQENLIRDIRSEIFYLDEEITDTRMIIESLEEDLSKLKDEYAAMVYAAYKSDHGLNKLTYLFSASSFAELRARWKYMEYYSEVRKKQAIQINKVTETLGEQIAGVETKRNEKSALLSEQLAQNKELKDLKNQRSRIVSSLQEQESTLKQDLKKEQQALSNLEKRITEIINAEIAARAKDSPSKTSEFAVISGTFAKNKSKLSWPVEGFVSQKFGRQNHAALKGVVLDNDGISIQTKKNEMARAIFDGDVRYVFFVPTMGYSALIKHGEYFTVYGGLKEPLVKTGDTVKAGQKLGEVVTKPEGVTELWFEIRKGRNPLNPEQWLVKR